MTPKLVIFDNDGVLVDSERLTNAVLARRLTAIGLPTDFDEAVVRYMGRSNSDCLADVEAALGRRLPETFLGDFEAECAQMMHSELTPVAGVPELLDALDDRGVRRCVASSGTPKEIALRLSVTGLQEGFGDRVYSATMVERGKPAPDLFLHAARQMGVAVDDCVVIEDSPAGVAGAKAAGIRVLGHASLAPEARLREAGADEVVHDMRHVAALLEL